MFCNPYHAMCRMLAQVRLCLFPTLNYNCKTLAIFSISIHFNLNPDSAKITQDAGNDHHIAQRFKINNKIWYYWGSEISSSLSIFFLLLAGFYTFYTLSHFGRSVKNIGPCEIAPPLVMAATQDYRICQNLFRFRNKLQLMLPK